MKKLLLASLLSIAAISYADYGVYGTTNTSSKGTDNPTALTPANVSQTAMSPAVTSVEKSNQMMDPMRSNNSFNMAPSTAATKSTYPGWNMDRGISQNRATTSLTPDLNNVTPGNNEVSSSLYNQQNVNTSNTTPGSMSAFSVAKDLNTIE
jgi:hypothetical protein